MVVVGGGNSAGQATLFLSRYAPEVHVLIRGDTLLRDMSRYLADRIERTPNVRVMLETEVREVEGDATLEAVVAEHRRQGRVRIPAKAMFVFIGAVQHSGWLDGLVRLDYDGIVLTGPAIGRGRDGQQCSVLETSTPGVLAVGDVRSGSIKRVASAVGEGSMAVRLVHEHLARAHGHPHHAP